jgi:group I intron endonuclease
MASVYLVTNTVNGKQYVGFTSRTVEERWSQHVSQSKAKRQAIAKAICKYGPEVFEVRALATGMSDEFALALEVAAIQALGTLVPAGYNLTSGGGQAGHHEETKAKMSATRKGRKYSDEHRQNISDALKGKTQSEEVIARAAATRKAYYDLHPEARELKRAQATGRKVSAETRAKLSEAGRRRGARAAAGETP